MCIALKWISLWDLFNETDNSHQTKKNKTNPCDLFNETDNKLLDYLEDDGNSIEPKHYVPIIPLVLLNGSTGIGTGWSTDIPCFNIKDVIEMIRNLLENENAEIKTLYPWYKDNNDPTS